MNARTKKQALKALDGMREIVNNEMLIHGQYVTEDVINPTMADSLCGGRQYCAIGALWVGAGVKVERRYGGVALPGAMYWQRSRFVAGRPALAAALDHLDAAAERYAKRHGITVDEEAAIGESSLEDLFEDGSVPVGRPELLKIIASAKRKIAAA